MTEPKRFTVTATVERALYGRVPDLINNVVEDQRRQLAREFVRRLQPNMYFVVRLDEEWMSSYQHYDTAKLRVASLTMYPTETHRVRFVEREFNKMSWRQLEDSAIKEIRWRVRHHWMMFW